MTTRAAKRKQQLDDASSLLSSPMSKGKNMVGIVELGKKRKGLKKGSPSVKQSEDDGVSIEQQIDDKNASSSSSSSTTTTTTQKTDTMLVDRETAVKQPAPRRSVEEDVRMGAEEELTYLIEEVLDRNGKKLLPQLESAKIRSIEDLVAARKDDDLLQKLPLKDDIRKELAHFCQHYEKFQNDEPGKIMMQTLPSSLLPTLCFF